MDIQTFRQRFKAFSEDEQSFLKALAIAYEPLNQTATVNLLRECEIKTDKGTAFTGPLIKEIRGRLEDAGWLKVNLRVEMQVTPKYLEMVMRMAVIDKRFKKWVKATQAALPYRQWAYAPPRSFEVCLRELRIALYDGDMKQFGIVMMDINRFFREIYARSNFFGQFFQPFEPEWLATFSGEIQELAIAHLMKECFENLDNPQPYLQYAFDRNWLNNKTKGEPFFSQLNTWFLLKGDLEAAAAALAGEQPSYGKSAREGAVSFFKGNNLQAISRFEEGLRQFRKILDQRSAYYPDLMGILYPLALMKDGMKEMSKKLQALATATEGGPIISKVIKYLLSAALYQENKLHEAWTLNEVQPNSPLDWLFYGVVSWWNERYLPLPELEKLRRWRLKAQENGYSWLEMEFAHVLSVFEPSHEMAAVHAQEYQALKAKLHLNSLLDLQKRTEKWERSIEALLKLQGGKKRKTAADKPEKTTRLVWWVDFDNRQIQPVEQSFSKGAWSKGRNIALKRMKEGGVEGLSDQDQKVAKAIRVHNHGYYGGVEYFFDFTQAVQALVGHPLLFLMENPAVSVELIEKQPELLVEEQADGFSMKFAQEFRHAGPHLLRETPTRYQLMVVEEAHAEVNRLLEYGNLKFPVKAKDKIVEAVGHLSSIVTVQSAVGGETAVVETVSANPTPHLHLLPVGNGFKIEFFVKPFTTDPPYFKPGLGRENIIAEISGAPKKVIRDLKKEKELARKVEDACPSFLRAPGVNQEWLFEEVEDCLNVLVELEPLRTGGEVVMEYPKGEKLRVAGRISFDNLSLGIRKDRDWFEVSGKVRINENMVMDFRELLDRIHQSKGSFVQISDGQFLSITSQLRRKLEEMNNVLTKTKNDLRFHPLAASMLDDFTGLLHDVETDAAWKKQLTRLKEARTLQAKVPSTFKAELRNYQEEGFRWLSQLAYWGVGACLADDMGLGKTIQALAVLVDRGKQGPSLVVAPASVVRNWRAEAERFAPTLRPLLFGEGDRKEMLDKLQPFDLLLSSYGLMQQESELFKETHFTTIILDEAQAIKNRATKRSQTAMQLQSDFKIITTGTPVENHLGEIWNLFNFLNPGLLGSLDRFNETYAIPIEKYQDKDRRNQLRRLLQPFILRRRKNDVLEELPEKTEITLTVELSQEERAFYEALRRKAIENIESGEGSAQDKRFTILAELMRLRQACCHPRMVSPESKLSGSKLGLFADTVEELLENGHKALIFSQFVKHLKIVEEWVKERGISYQYLDGSTPLPTREKSIRAFQAGEGDLFLISLKAGGFGLNLTAADYVIHLDPWWNPAVEDQASDRAHRIGQQRPVTIYRLVTADTIEDKIVKLHADKRDLADSLLEGTEVSAGLSAEELLALIKG
jgi:superfamily II DNA or RNA helicase